MLRIIICTGIGITKGCSSQYDHTNEHSRTQNHRKINKRATLEDRFVIGRGSPDKGLARIAPRHGTGQRGQQTIIDAGVVCGVGFQQQGYQVVKRVVLRIWNGVW